MQYVRLFELIGLLLPRCILKSVLPINSLFICFNDISLNYFLNFRFRRVRFFWLSFRFAVTIQLNRWFEFFPLIVAFNVLICRCCLFVIFLTLTSYCFFLIFFSLYYFILHKWFRPVFYWLSDLISKSFQLNHIFMPTSGLHKMLYILIEIVVYIFRDNALIGFGLFFTGLSTFYCVFQRAKKMRMRVSVFWGRGGINNCL